MIHELKTCPSAYDAVCAGEKTHEARRADRFFSENDTLLLREWLPDEARYTGQEACVRVTHVTQGIFGVPEDLCVMSIRLLHTTLMDEICPLDIDRLGSIVGKGVVVEDRRRTERLVVLWTADMTDSDRRAKIDLLLPLSTKSTLFLLQSPCESDGHRCRNCPCPTCSEGREQCPHTTWWMT